MSINAAAEKQHSNNILIGAGRLFFDKLNSDGQYTGERDLGDAVSATYATEQETATVLSGSGAISTTLAQVVQSTARRFTVVLHDISPENIALLTGANAGSTADVATAVVDEVIDTAHGGRWYQLGRAASKPSGVNSVTKSTVNVTYPGEGNADTTAVAGTDFAVDDATARIFIYSAGACAGKKIKVDYTPIAKTRDEIKTGDTAQVSGALAYFEEPRNDGALGKNYYARKCVVTSGGELALMSRDTEQQIQLQFEVVEPDDDFPALTINGELA